MAGMTKQGKKTEKIKKVLRDAKPLEILGSGLDRKTLQTLKDFWMFQLF